MSISVIDSHTAGEATRIIVAGGPRLNGGTLAEQREIFSHQFDHVRSAVVNEPRGSDVLVGGWLCEPTDSTCVAGIIFFNNVGYLGMCGHGTIGAAVTLAHLGRITPGRHRLETPVGIVPFTYHGENRVTFDNIPSYRYRKDVAIEVPEVGQVIGDIAWGGNWFYLVHHHGQVVSLSRVDQLTDFCWRIRQTLNRQQITGANGAEIDHIDLFGPPSNPHHHSRNFVLCPGKAFDRSPCGTGTSAKLACLAAEGTLQPGETWRQESILGTVFEASFRWENESHAAIIPSITGEAFITGEATLHFHPRDPFRYGIRNVEL